MFSKGKFSDFILRNKIDNKLFLLGFMFAMLGYSAWQPLEKTLGFSEENEGIIYFLCIALSFLCYTSAYLFTKWDSWHYFPLFVAVICFSRFLNEIYYMVYPLENPDEYNIFDYINFLITIWIIFNYYVVTQKKIYDKLKENEQQEPKA